MEPYIKEFIEEVYPEYTELALASFNEKECLTEATKIMRTLRELLEEASGVIRLAQNAHNAVTEEAFYEYCKTIFFPKAQALLARIRKATGKE